MLYDAHKRRQSEVVVTLSTSVEEGYTENQTCEISLWKVIPIIVKITFNTKETIKNKFGEKSKAEKRRIQRKMERGWLGMDQIKTDYQRRT